MMQVNAGMLRLYEGEVLGKLPVIQHFLFGCACGGWAGWWPGISCLLACHSSSCIHIHARAPDLLHPSVDPLKKYIHTHGTDTSSFFPATWKPQGPTDESHARLEASAHPDDGSGQGRWLGPGRLVD